MASKATTSKWIAGVAGVFAVGNVAFGCLAMIGVEISFALASVFHWVMKIFFPNLPPGEDPTRFCFFAFIVFPVLLAAAFFLLPKEGRERAWVLLILCVAHWGLVAAHVVRDDLAARYTRGQVLAEVVVSIVHWPVVSSVVIAACAFVVCKLREEPSPAVSLSEGS